MTANRGPTIIRCDSSSDVPRQEHWAIIEFSSVMDSYNDRQPVQYYTAYLVKNEWIDAVKNRTNQIGGNEFVAIAATRAKIVTTVTVE